MSVYLKTAIVASVVSLLYINCHNGSVSNKQGNDGMGKPQISNTVSSPNESRKLKDSTDIKSFLANIRNAKFIAAEKKYQPDPGSDNRDSSRCAKWHLTEKEMIHIIEMSEPLDGTAWDLGYAWMPCYYSCKIEVNKVPAEVKLNAGSWLWINFDDTSILRSCDAKAMRKYFLAHVQN